MQEQILGTVPCPQRDTPTSSHIHFPRPHDPADTSPRPRSPDAARCASCRNAARLESMLPESMRFDWRGRLARAAAAQPGSISSLLSRAGSVAKRKPEAADAVGWGEGRPGRVLGEKVALGSTAGETGSPSGRERGFDDGIRKRGRVEWPLDRGGDEERGRAAKPGRNEVGGAEARGRTGENSAGVGDKGPLAGGIAAMFDAARKNAARKAANARRAGGDESKAGEDCCGGANGEQRVDRYPDVGPRGDGQARQRGAGTLLGYFSRSTR